jgi:hypothetical protein
MNFSQISSSAKKVSVTIETEDGMTYVYNFGDNDRARLKVNAAVNQQYMDSYHGSIIPTYQHTISREFNLKINY